MAITQNAERQYPLVASVSFSGATADAEVLATGAYPAINIPAGAVVTGGWLDITTVFTATCDIDIGDGVDPDRYSSVIINADSLGRTDLTLDGGAADASYIYPEDDTIDITLAVAATIVGAASLYVEYVMTAESRSNEIQD